MRTLLGSIDARHRPLVRIELPNGRDSALALLDTGFNGTLLAAERDLATLEFRMREGHSSVELAGGHTFDLRRGEGLIVWLGRERRIEVLISTEPPTVRNNDEPILLVGTRLLAPHLLLIDFATGTVEIEAHE